MRRLFGVRGIVYVIYTLMFFTLIYYMDSVPNHSDGTSDYDTWFVWLYLPALLVYHGLMSKVILRGHRFYVPLVVTAVFGFAEALISKTDIALLVFGIEKISVTSALFATIYYLAFTAAGVMVMNICRWLYFAIMALKCFYEH